MTFSTETDACETRRLPNNRAGHLREMEDGWDSYGGSKPAMPVIETAEAIERCIAYVPMGDGRVQVEFHCGGADLELTIDLDGQIREIAFTTHPPQTPEAA